MPTYLLKSVPVNEGNTKSLPSHSTVIIMIDKTPCWMPKSEGESLKRNRISAWSKIFVRDKGENTNLTVEKPGGHHLVQMMRVNITSDKRQQHHVPLTSGTERTPILLLWYSCLKHTITVL